MSNCTTICWLLVSVSIQGGKLVFTDLGKLYFDCCLDSIVYAMRKLIEYWTPCTALIAQYHTQYSQKNSLCSLLYSLHCTLELLQLWCCRGLRDINIIVYFDMLLFFSVMVIFLVFLLRVTVPCKCWPAFVFEVNWSEAAASAQD